LIAVLVGAWWAVSELELIDPLLISSPQAVWDFLREAVQTHEFWSGLRATLTETLWGFLIGSAAGIFSGLLLARFAWLDSLTDPVLTFLNALPRIALAPLFLLWFGIGGFSKIMLAASLVFFILLANTRAGVKSVDPQMALVSRVLGANEGQVVRTVILPAAVPSVFGGLRLASVYALLGVIAGEMVAAQQGLGQQLTFYSGSFDTAGVLGILFVLGLIGALLNGVMVLIERRLLRWRDTT
jgi:NitT/TauT family transport system permease protein